MFPKLALFALSALALLAAAAPGGLSARDSCDNGSLQCCNNFYDASSPEAASALADNGLAARDAQQGPVGVGCKSGSFLGVGGRPACSSQSMCCEDNSFHGLIVLGCSPITVEL